MNESSPSVLLGPGFLGEWRRAERPVAVSRGEAGVFAALREAVRACPPGGLVAGYLGYEAAREVEASVALPPPPPHEGRSLPPAWIGTFAATRLVPPPTGPACARPVGTSGTDTKPGYERKVADVIGRIRAGDLFQANLSRRLSASFATRADLAQALFSRLCSEQSADYAAFVSFEEGAVLSNSPELFLRVEGDRVTAEPIKGTRPRGASEEEDRALAEALAADPKDRAENVMIADLLRNDLSKVSEDWSVEAGPVCALRTLPHVHHLYSRVTARLRPGLGPVDALEAAFPCGSVTGAPKPEALAVIAALEGEGRGPYCGTAFAIEGDRAVFSVPIRTGVLTYGEETARLDVRAGGGVTILSDPAAEWMETVAKAYPFGAMTGTP